MLTQKIENRLLIEVDGIDLTGATDIEFYVRQGKTFFEYTPQIVDASHMAVVIPKEDAMQLATVGVKLQFALTGADGNARNSDVIVMTAEEFLKEAGYGD